MCAIVKANRKTWKNGARQQRRCAQDGNEGSIEIKDAEINTFGKRINGVKLVQNGRVVLWMFPSEGWPEGNKGSIDIWKRQSS